METIKMLLEHIVIRHVSPIIVTFFLLSNSILAQKRMLIPELLNGESVVNTLKLKCIQREKCLGVGIYKFRVASYGRVDSVTCLSNLGNKADSLQIIEIKKLDFKSFANQDILPWFQIKIYSTYLTHQSSKYLKGLESSIELLYEQEAKDYFPDSDHPDKTYTIKENVILLPPLRLRVVQ